MSAKLNSGSNEPNLWATKGVSPICMLVAAALTMLGGCYLHRAIVLRNAAGDTVTCEMSAGSAIGLGGLALGPVMRDASLKDCVRAYESAGYRVISDTRPGDEGVPATPVPQYPVMR
jgi:hypothetical protein